MVTLRKQLYVLNNVKFKSPPPRKLVIFAKINFIKL